MDVRVTVLVMVSAFSSFVQSKDMKSALIVIDVQNCFTEGGTLEVADGNAVIPVINRINQDMGEFFDQVIFSKDWHCDNHVSFASQHQGYSVYSSKTLQYDAQGTLCRTANVTNSFAKECIGSTTPIRQTLWPDHCVKNTADADIHAEIQSMASKSAIILKGDHCEVDSYSAFFDNGKFRQTDLHSLLSSKMISRIYITGLATDYCVYYTALDGKSLGYETYVVLDATRGVDPKTTEAALLDMKEEGIKVISSYEIGDSLLGDIASSAFARGNGSLLILFVAVTIGSLVQLLLI